MKVWNEHILISIIVDDYFNPKSIHKYNLKNGFLTQIQNVSFSFDPILLKILNNQKKHFNIFFIWRQNLICMNQILPKYMIDCNELIIQVYL